MSATPNLGLSYIDAGQAQKHVTHNEALRSLDSIVQLAVQDRDLPAPPDDPAEGQRWIVKATATAAWVGHENHIAAWQDGAWQFSAPGAGWVAYVIDEEILAAWDGAAWSPLSTGEGGGGGGEIAELQNLSLLGIGATADSSNPLSATLNNALWSAKTVADGGDGTLRYILSKESADKTLSFLFQDNFVGCAEIGLTGDDDFHFKVSPDGVAWLESIKIDRATGKVSFPSGGAREVLSADRNYYVRSDGSDSNNGLSNSSGGAFATIQKALDLIWGRLDLAGFNVAVQVGAGTYTNAGIGGPLVGLGTVAIIGDVTTPANVVISITTGSASCFKFGGGARVTIKGFKLVNTGGTAGGEGNGILAVDSGTYVSIPDKMDFGATTAAHMRVSNGAQMMMTGVPAYTISGDAARHIYATNTGLWQNAIARTVTASGTRNFSAAFAEASEGAFVRDNNATFSGTFTGKRWSASANGIINLFGGTANTYYPGNSNGTAATGGQTV